MASEPPPLSNNILQPVKNSQAETSKKPTYSSVIQNNLLQPLKINSPVSPRTAKKTFQNENLQDDLQLVSVLPPETYHNHPAAVLYVEEVAVLAEKLKWQLVGKFNRMPDWEKIQNHFKKMQLSGAYSVQWFNYRNIFIKLTNEFDYAKVRSKPIFDFDANHRMRILKWDTKFSPEKESSVVPVWITFPSLPNHLYNKDTLKILANTLGNPLQMDDPTAKGTRPSHPRICIEFDCLKPPPDQIFIHLTENWEIGNRKSGKRESHHQDDPHRIVTNNSFSTLDKEIENPTQERQQVSGLHTCEFNCEASIPGSSTFEESESARPHPVKNPLLKKGDSSEENKSVFTPAEKGSNLEVCRTESARRACNQEDLVIVEEGSEDDDDRLPETAIPAVALPKNDVDPVKGSHLCETSNQTIPVSEKVQKGGGISDLSVDGVAQENSAGVVAAQLPVNVLVNAKVAAEVVSMGPQVEGGPTQPGPDPPQIPSGLGHPMIHASPPAGPKAQTNNSPPLVAVEAAAQPITLSASPNPDVQPKVLSSSTIRVLDPDDRSQDGKVSPSHDSPLDSDAIDNWVLSERRAERRNAVLNREATPFFPTMGLHSSSWIEDGEDSGPAFPQFERHCDPQGDGLSDRDDDSNVSTYSEYRAIDEDFEDDFTVNPPRKWNSTNNLHPMPLLPRLSPPITRSKGFKLGKGKNKLRW